MPKWLPVTGTIVADRQAQVAADATGVVVSTSAERGQPVKKGDELVVIDTRISQLSAVASGAQEGVARAQLEAAQKDCERAKQLLDQGVIPQAQYDRTAAQCEAQSKALQAASASADIAQTSLSKTRVRAPFDGRIGDRLVEVGAFVANASPVVTLYAVEALRVRFTVPEAKVASIVQDAPIKFRVAASDQEYDGMVRYVSPALREQTRDLVVEAVAENTDGNLRPGMFASVRVAVASVPQPVVPDSAVRGADTVHTVFTVREGRAFENVVRVGAEQGGYTAVLTDLADGDEIVVDPPAGLRDGQLISGDR
jgi:membrane fusion protein (multidrug efflux system)